MIGWLQPAALWGLVLIAGPILVHLLQKRRATRVQFPSLRFVRSSQTAAVRLQPPADWLLLVVRVTIVALAVCAAAQPLLLTSGRLEAWNARLARAVVVDTSASMRDDDGVAADQAHAAAEAELRAPWRSVRIDTADPGKGLAQALAWFPLEGPARREIVVISDMQRGAIAGSDLSAIPADVGVRFVRVGSPAATRRAPGYGLLGAPGVLSRSQEIELSAEATRVLITRDSREPGAGLRIIASPEQQDDVTGLLRAVAIAGAPSPEAREPIAIRFSPDAHAAPFVAAVREPWMLRTVLRLRDDDAVRRLAAGVSEPGLPDVEPWAGVVWNTRGEWLVRAAAGGNELLIDVAAPPSSLLSAAVVRAALAARLGAVANPEAEVARIDPGTLSAWNREPAAVGPDAWRQAESSDARWLWAAALVLMFLEGWLRSRPNRVVVWEGRRAAA